MNLDWFYISAVGVILLAIVIFVSAILSLLIFLICKKDLKQRTKKHAVFQDLVFFMSALVVVQGLLMGENISFVDAQDYQDCFSILISCYMVIVRVPQWSERVES